MVIELNGVKYFKTEHIYSSESSKDAKLFFTEMECLVVGVSLHSSRKDLFEATILIPEANIELFSRSLLSN